MSETKGKSGANYRELKKRLKLNSSQESIESNAVDELGVFIQTREPRLMLSSQSNSEG